MKLMILIVLLVPLVFAETTFFDNPDDVFIMGNSDSVVTGGVTMDETIDGTVGGGGCLYKWNCTDWGECSSSGKQTRDCVNVGTCLDRYRVPEMERDCDYIGSLEDLNEENIIERGWEEESDKEEIVYWYWLLVFSVAVLVILFVVFYLGRNYFRKLIKKSF